MIFVSMPITIRVWFNLCYSKNVCFLLTVSAGRFLHAPVNVTASYKGTARINIRYNLTSAEDLTPVGRTFKQLLFEYTDKSTGNVIIVATGNTNEFTLNTSPFKTRATTNLTLLQGGDSQWFEISLGDLSYNDDLQFEIILIYEDPSNSVRFDSESVVTHLIVKGMK